MSTSDSGKSSAGRLFGLVALVVLIVLVFVRRSQYPDGSFLVQERTYYTERLNPDIGEVLEAVAPGETTTAELVDDLGEPTDKVNEDGLELWVYTTRSTRVTDRALLGLIRVGGGTDSVESSIPVGVKDGVVVHTYVSQSGDPATKQAVEAMWDAYTTRR